MSMLMPSPVTSFSLSFSNVPRSPLIEIGRGSLQKSRPNADTVQLSDCTIMPRPVSRSMISITRESPISRSGSRSGLAKSRSSPFSGPALDPGMNRSITSMPCPGSAGSWK